MCTFPRFLIGHIVNLQSIVKHYLFSQQPKPHTTFPNGHVNGRMKASLTNSQWYKKAISDKDNVPMSLL